MANLPDYNKDFLADPGKIMPNARYGITVKLADTLPGQPYWRAIGIRHLNGDENRGNHHVYVDVLDEQGKRIKGARIGILNSNLPPVYAVIDKPDNEPGANAPMSSGDLLALYVHGEHPSEKAQGFRSTHPDEPPGNTWGHHSFYVVFQKTKEGSGPTPEPEPQPEPQPTPKPEPTPEPQPVPNWRSKLTPFKRAFLRELIKAGGTLEAQLAADLVDILDGKL